VYCGINLQTSKALRDINQFCFWYGYHEVLQMGERSTWLIFSCFTHDHENFEMCGVFHANQGLWESRFRVIKLGCYVIVDIGCKYVTFSLNVRIKILKIYNYNSLHR